MTIKKYSTRKSIRTKINQLFEYRKLTELLRRSGLQKVKPFTDQLKEVQYRIYLLDAYLEGQWTLQKGELKSYREDILQSIVPMNVARKKIPSLLKEIDEYERIERNCRKNKWPDKISFRKFYKTKSCDVRLIRKLIYMADPRLSSLWKETSWRFYDRITEINDDITDLREDLGTYNINRFLISTLRKGHRKTAHEYTRYLVNVTERAEAWFKDHQGQGENEILHKWTMARSEETIQLLNHTIESTDPGYYSGALLLGHMT